MPRATLTKTTPLGPYPTLQPAANALDLTMTAGDAINLNQFVLSGPVIIVAHNAGVGARTLTLTSKANSHNRTGDIAAYSIGANEIAVFKIDQFDGWRQTDGMLYLAAEHAEVKVGIIQL